jgi:hypothetical protein
MRKSFATTLLAVTLITLSTACSPEDGYVRPKVWPKPTEPPPASPIYRDVDEKVPTEEDLARATEEHTAILAAELESGLLGDDAIRRETVLVYILPELLQVEPGRIVDMHKRLEPGKLRGTFAVDIAQFWTSSDPQAAMQWLKSLEGDERREAVIGAVTALAPWDPQQAVRLVDEFGLQRENDVRKILSSIKQVTSEPQAH